MEEKKHYVYILKCSNGSLYTGWTTDLQARIKAHNQGIGAKYTRSHRPVELVHYEAFQSRSDALKREAQIKKMRRTEKLILFQK
ncbi:MAG: GIY-YIG nuclease family protein [Anaerovorax sp.]|nr:GIY-YIG nuclease family protein [Anaerovorax sp.]